MKPVAALVALCLAASVALAADPAEELYQKVSDAWAKAKTLHLKDVSSSAKEPDGSAMKCVADLWLGEGSRVNVSGSIESGDHKEEFTALSDGTTLVLASGGAEESRGEAVKELGEKARALLVHGGYMVFLSMLHAPGAVVEGGTSEFKMGADAKVGDRAATVIEYTYKFTVDGDEQTLAVKLYVDPEKLQVLKREFTDSKTVSFTEEYPSIEVDAAPPEGAFTVPPAPGK